jgi:hypothetical protein
MTYHSLIQGKDVFLHGDAADLDITDTAKFALPLISAIIACLISIVCIVLMFHICTSTEPAYPVVSRIIIINEVNKAAL